MKRIFLVASLFFATTAMADEFMVCKQYGYTDKGEEFHSIKTHDLENTFTLQRNSVTIGGTEYTAVDPAIVGFEPGTIAYYYRAEKKVLYFYMNGKKREIGISRLNADSDDFFSDKHLFADCSFKQPKGGDQHAVAPKPSSFIETGRIGPTVQVYRF